MLSELKKELIATERELPYNEVSRYLVRAGESEGIPRAFGCDCIDGTADLLGRLREKTTAKLHFLPVVRGPHQAVVVGEGRETYLLDPYTLHQEPIPLSEILEGRTPRSFAIFPQHQTVAQPALVVHPYSQTSFRVELMGDPFDPDSPSEAYGFDLSKLNEASTPMELKHLRKGRRGELALRTLDEDNGVTNLFFNFETRHFGIKRVGGKNPRTFKETYNEGVFRQEFEKVSTTLQVSPEQLRSYFHRAVAIQAEL